ncbi:MAG TPA: endonuclease/exonuclease/phosphatase family protein [Bryobacteraceae bacterium]|nr:endonuclease/exonuclease/phosphatase family protein [Bryobacteraceae bacterium]
MTCVGQVLLLLLFLGSVPAWGSQEVSRESSPELLDMADLKALAGREPPAATMRKLELLLHTPFIRNRAATIPSEGTPSDFGLRVAFWNIERGQQLELIRNALADPPRFRTIVEAGRQKRVPDRKWRRAEAELALLRSADVILLNEVDLGMKRSGYADVARELADTLHMNYAFGVEFVEVDGLYTGDERIKMKTPEETQALADDLRADPARYRGLHGNAILTRFPLRSVRVARLPECYDWYGEELDGIAALEKQKRWAAKKVFAERMMRQVRRGGRMALVAELEVDGAPARITVVSAHLEDHTRSACRGDQVEALMTQLRNTPGVVVVGGDLNTSGMDGTPTSIRYEIKKRVANPRFWTNQGFRWFTPLSVPAIVTFPINLWKNHHDPTAVHVPFFLPNRARQIFRKLRGFEFADGGRFDFTGNATRSGNRRGRSLANSNQRAWKGFHPTYHMERTYFFAGTYRLDWLLVKPAPQQGGAALFRPRNPRTLRAMNELGRERLSDHQPITVDLEPLPNGTSDPARTNDRR